MTTAPRTAATRHAITRRVLITLAGVAVFLLLYVGSFAWIRWYKPRALQDLTVMKNAYDIVYWPLRWLTAERPAGMPWWRSTTTMHATIDAIMPIAVVLRPGHDVITLRSSTPLPLRPDGTPQPAPGQPGGFARGDSITIQVYGDLATGISAAGDWYPEDVMMPMIRSIDHRAP